MKKFIALILSCLFITSCAGIVEKNMPDQASLKPGQGILAVNIGTNADVLTVSLINQANALVSSAVFTIGAGNNLKVVSLPAGNYYWRNITVGGGHAELGNRLAFKIEEGKINYIGDVKFLFANGLNAYRVAIANNQDAMKHDLSITYPNIYRAIPFTVNLTKDTQK